MTVCASGDVIFHLAQVALPVFRRYDFSPHEFVHCGSAAENLSRGDLMQRGNGDQM